MSDGNEDDSLLLGIIPSFRRTPEQVARWDEVGESPTFKLLRDPINLQELNQYNHEIAIWRENRTLTYVSPFRVNDDDHNSPYEKRRMLSLKFGHNSPRLHIAGETDDSVAETAEYFMSFGELAEDNSASLEYYNSHRTFDLHADRSRCLTRLFEAPWRHIELQSMMLSVDQLVVLATRPHPIHLTLFECSFEDEGAAFVDALERRQSPFGLLLFDGGAGWFNDYNMKRLFQTEGIEHLSVPYLFLDDYLGFYHLTAKVDSLDCLICVPSLMADLSSVNIVAKKLSFTIEKSGLDDFPAEPVISFFRHLANLGHFEELAVSFHFHDGADFGIPNCVVQEIINAALANSNLQVLDLKASCEELQWSEHSIRLLEGLKDHKTLKTLRISLDDDDQDEAFGPDCWYLQRFLSHNRNVDVTNTEGDIYADWCMADELYSLNLFYRGSKALVVDPLSERSSLVATALMESISNNFQRSALLMFDHVDALHELVQYAQLDELDEDDLPMPSHQNQKRQRRV